MWEFDHRKERMVEDMNLADATIGEEYLVKDSIAEDEEWKVIDKN